MLGPYEGLDHLLPLLGTDMAAFLREVRLRLRSCLLFECGSLVMLACKFEMTHVRLLVRHLLNDTLRASVVVVLVLVIVPVDVLVVFVGRLVAPRCVVWLLVQFHLLFLLHGRI